MKLGKLYKLTLADLESFGLYNEPDMLINEEMGEIKNGEIFLPIFVSVCPSTGYPMTKIILKNKIAWIFDTPKCVEITEEE